MNKKINALISERENRCKLLGIAEAVVFLIYYVTGAQEELVETILYIVMGCIARFLAEDLTVIFYGKKQKNMVPIRPDRVAEDDIKKMMFKERMQTTSVGAKKEVTFIIGMIIAFIVGLLAASTPVIISQFDILQIVAISTAIGVWAGYSKGMNLVDRSIEEDLL